MISLAHITEKLTLHPIPGDEGVERSLERAHGEGKKGLYFPVQMRLVSWWIRTDSAREEAASPRVSLKILQVNACWKRLLP